MNNKNVMIIIVAVLLMGLIIINSGFAQKEQTVHMKLPINNVATQNTFVKDEVFNKGNITHFGKNTSNLGSTSFLEITFKMNVDQNNGSLMDIKGTGVVSIEGSTYPFKVEDRVKTYTLLSGEKMLFGPLTGTITTQKGEQFLNLDLHHILGTDKKEIIITISNLGSKDGVGAAIFGKPFLTKELVSVIKGAN